MILTKLFTYVCINPALQSEMGSLHTVIDLANLIKVDGNVVGGCANHSPFNNFRVG